MTFRRPHAVGLLAVLLAMSAAAPAMASESPAPEPPLPQVWLKGAFGRVAGGLPAEPATAAPDDRPLDAWMRAAPLELTTDVPAADVLGFSVTARPIGGAEEVVLSTDVGVFDGPDAPGLHELLASLETIDGVSEHAWLLDVPARSGSPELLFEIPGAVAVLRSVGGEVTGAPGHGCYAYLCVEAGYRPPVDTLTPLTVAVGETPELRLDDGSALVHWQGFLEHTADPGTRVSEAEATFEATPRGVVELTGLEPAAAGEWLLEVRADYDRERGWQWFLFRLVTE